MTNNTVTVTSANNKPCFNGMPDQKCIHGVCVGGNMCNCYPGWSGFLCTEACLLPCVGGHCNIIQNTSFCNCWENFTGVLCDQVKPTLEPKYIYNGTRVEKTASNTYIVGAVLGPILLALAIVAIMCYIMWRHRALVIMKLIYWTQKYEDDDEKAFDAFISYKSSTSDANHGSSPEELFVVHTLMPKLEEELGFKLCVHFRDFVPGEHISDNVLDAIESSRRTIMLISRDYITKSVWTRFEYEQAELAVIERKQRIIPIIFEDISDVEIEDRTLRNILSTVTYLEWPGDEDAKKLTKFWALLTLSMPKLRSLSSSTLQSSADDVKGSSLNNSYSVNIDAMTTSSRLSNVGPDFCKKSATECVKTSQAMDESTFSYA